MSNAFLGGDLHERIQCPFGHHTNSKQPAAAINAMLQHMEAFSLDMLHALLPVIETGQLGLQIPEQNQAGTWLYLATTFNQMSSHYLDEVLQTTRVIRAVSQGDLSQRLAIENESGPLQELHQSMDDMGKVI